MTFIKTTEQSSKYNHLEKMTVEQLLTNINNEDKTIALAVEKCIPQITLLCKNSIVCLKNGGRLFYIGSGTSGRLGILDASECPPTFGVDHNLIIGLIAGGDSAIRKAVEFAEDSKTQGWEDLQKYNICTKDVLIGIAASGTTPYVLGAIEMANKNQILTGCITCNKNSTLSKLAQLPIEVIVGPEIVTGSSRMKAGTAQKLILNMISTTVMIQLGRIKDNKMIDMQLSNTKLIHRGTKIIQNELGITESLAQEILLKYGSVRAALKYFNDEK